LKSTRPTASLEPVGREIHRVSGSKPRAGRQRTWVLTDSGHTSQSAHRQDVTDQPRLQRRGEGRRRKLLGRRKRRSEGGHRCAGGTPGGGQNPRGARSFRRFHRHRSPPHPSGEQGPEVEGVASGPASKPEGASHNGTRAVGLGNRFVLQAGDNPLKGKPCTSAAG